MPLVKCLKCPVSEYPLAVNVLTIDSSFLDRLSWKTSKFVSS